MVISIKDIFKLFGISLIALCAVLVCTLFINFNIDIVSIEQFISTETERIVYDAQRATGYLTTCISGVCLVITSVVMLFFYIKYYIDSHKKELGILKALGYSNFKISLGFWKFGLSVLFGAILGFSLAYALMPMFYDTMNEEKILPDYNVCFHPELIIYLILIPTLVFSMIAIFYSCKKMKRSALSLLSNSEINKLRKPKKETDLPFLKELKKSNFRQRPVLVFFIGFAVFCFSAMTQMSLSMKELSSAMMGYMILIIGVVLAIVILLIGITTIINANKKSISIMHAFGYSNAECAKSILSSYRIVSYIGFIIGTVYQFGILKFAMTVFFKDMESIPEYKFSFPRLFIILGIFVVLYELLMFYYSRKIRKISIKEVMLDNC